MDALLGPADVSYIKKSISQKDLSLEINLSFQHASTQKNYRQQLRQDLLEHLKFPLNSEESKEILDLSKPPRVIGKYISVSHCHEVGGYAVSNMLLGFDLEVSSRLTLPLIQRISTEAELATCTEPLALWPAKEAAFKCLSALSSHKEKKPAVISEIRTTDWMSHSEISAWSYRLMDHPTLVCNHNKGFVFTKNSIFAAIYFC